MLVYISVYNCKTIIKKGIIIIMHGMVYEPPVTKSRSFVANSVS